MPENTDSRNGHRQRLREKFLQAGACAFADYELLEFFLTYALPRRDVKPIAKSLLKEFGSLSGVFDSSVDELCRIDGIGEYAAVLLKLNRELCKRYLASDIGKTTILNGVSKVYDYVRVKLGDLTEENVLVLFLNVRNCLIQEKIISTGTANQVNVFPAQIAKAALLCNASAVILSHNHPSGIVTPSKEDIQTTIRVKNTLKPLDITLLDHVVASKFAYYSFREHDMDVPDRKRILDPIETVTEETTGVSEESAGMEKYLQ